MLNQGHCVCSQNTTFSPFSCGFYFPTGILVYSILIFFNILLINLSNTFLVRNTNTDTLVFFQVSCLIAFDYIYSNVLFNLTYCLLIFKMILKFFLLSSMSPKHIDINSPVFYSFCNLKLFFINYAIYEEFI